MNPPKPTIHYDHMMGGFPPWREAVTEALQGAPTRLDAEIAFLDSTGLRAAAKLLASSYLYAASGQQAYVIGPRVQDLLHETDLSAVPVAFLKLPYECIYVSLPPSEWKIWGGDRTGWHTVGGVYMTTGPSVLTMVFWGKENEKSLYVGDDANFWATMDLSQCLTSGPEDTRTINLEESVRSMMSRWTDESDLDPEMRGRTDEILAHQLENVRHIVRVCVNMVLYLNSSDPETSVVNEGGPNEDKRKRLKREARKKGKKGDLARRRLKAMTEARIVWIGPSLERRPKSVMLKPVTGRTCRPHWRKGHFHAYWVGSRKDDGGNLRKGSHQILKWVAPTFVGDMAEMVRARGTLHKFREDKQ